MAALAATRERRVREVNVAWLVAVARHKLVDHWRRLAREQRSLAAVEHAGEPLDDPCGQSVELFEPIRPAAGLGDP